MKKILTVLLVITAFNLFSQDLSEETKRKFSFGVDVFTDIWQKLPSSVESKTINQGVNISGSYNFKINESNFSFSPGFGFSFHNLNNGSLTKTVNDSVIFYPVPDSIDFRRTKFNLSYFDVPLELRFKSEGGVRFAFGFKFGIRMKAGTKYKGDDYIDGTNRLVIYKKVKIPHTERWRYGLTLRLGYKWLNLWAYYQLSRVFEKGKGPDMYPISVGFSLMPF